MIIAMRRRVFHVIRTMPSFPFITAAAPGWGFRLGGRDGSGSGSTITIVGVFTPPSALPQRLLIGRLFS
jgi:hypothetical protein